MSTLPANALPSPPAPDAGLGSLDPGLLRFGEFEICPARRTLTRDGEPMRLGSRSFDLLVALCQRPGEILSNQDLMAAAWPNRVVDEGGVRVQIAALRKALGDGQDGRRFITNVPLRGYCFVAAVTAPDADTAPGGLRSVPAHPPVPRPVASRIGALPSALTPLVGRERDVDLVTLRLLERPCVTLVGPGGIGKTSVARAVAQRLSQREGFDVLFVELASLATAARTPMAIASTLGIMASDTDPLPAIAAALRSQPLMLLVLDNCEHVIDGAASTIDYLLAHAPNVRVLCTSRESLRIEGEWVQGLEPLALPPANLAHVDEALRYPAVSLFVERANATARGFQLGDGEVSLVSSICRSLDGIPLAIELAAAAVDIVGLDGLVDRLGIRLALLGRGRRTAAPRQQTMRATLDWSYHLLSADEQSMLAAFSIFKGQFSYAAACAVTGRSKEAVDVGLSGLVSKSLLSTDRSSNPLRYQLLEITREYAAERLAAGDDAPLVALRHAHFLRDLLRTRVDAPPQGQPQPTPRVCEPARWIDDVRQAIQWALSDPQTQTQALGISIAARAAPLYFSLSMLAEFRELAERALEMIDAVDSRIDSDAEDEMHLCEGLGHALWHTRADTGAMATAFRRALVIAEQRQATTSRMRCLWGLWLVCNATGDYAGSRALAERFGEIEATATDASARLSHARMMALGLHLDGDQDRAATFARLILDQPPAINLAAGMGLFQFDQRVAALAVTARIQWMQGRPDAALASAAEAVREAVSLDHALSLCYAIAIGAAPVAMWCGDLALARVWTDLLRQRSQANSLHFWRAFGDTYQQLLDLEDGRSVPGDVFPKPDTDTMLRETLCTVRPSLADDFVLGRARRGESGWCHPELLRVAGERHLAAGDVQAGAAAIKKGIDVSRRQGAISWELRCAMSLVRWSPLLGDEAAHRSELRAVFTRFHEGFATRDLCQAAQLLQPSDPR
ncbi:ATP-binding protein [Roseateles amylovorans]|uniref:Helix-turn-helix transcriptional regulator n=1 Tax=Roseateles amylovorans TaxID=2978473 RepID=A0ABY6AT23_9BURK|nr:helix-turn-helix transcriptional regulator [Roseateles amylovorans]UXH76167.1 helix-turn-helix transcriptional regulator [Roseateles amylovorans]